MSVGLDPDAFWSKTPQQVALIFGGQRKRFSREHNERAWLAWHIAALPRVKKFPKLEKLMDKSGASRRRQTPEQMLAIAKMMAGMSFPEDNRKPH